MVEHLKAWLALKTDRRGVTMLEYGLIAALIAAVCVGAVTTLGTDISNTFSAVAGSI
ncbi:MAG: Flp family type IVb pilin [Acetobacteraceae bacterium]|jgi:pilus assembly protein Flp/PilA